MKIKIGRAFIIVISLISLSVLSAISIDEKMGQLGSNEIEEGFDIEAEVKQLNPKLSQLRQQLKAQYQQIDLLIQNHA
ncbi:MAG: hypothetical protein K9M13_04030, partial [Simkaniaceae bacterium]|nr:hypothetical protein [Simkaniaceae bacterium]